MTQFRKHVRSAVIFVLVVIALSAARDAFRLESVQRSGRYEVGQRWSIKARPQDPQPAIVIGRIDRKADGEVVHVSVFGVKVADHRTPGRFYSDLSFVPLTRKSLDASVITLQGAGKTASRFETGYREWREADTLPFDIPVETYLELVERVSALAPAEPSTSNAPKNSF
jgi:hypothetical protein